VTAADLGVTPVGWAGAGQQIVDVADAPEREAGEIVEDEGEAHLKIVEFLDKLKVI
jgi:electron transfer flavoprotein beta subunit